MSVRRVTPGIMMLVLALACGVLAPPAPVPVEGSRPQLDSLSGNWSGTYRASGASRYGVLRFSLRPGADTAYGEVEMTFAPTQRLYGDPPEESMPRTPCRVLDIALVRMYEGSVRGTLAPYWDPDCQCEAVALFEGRMTGPDQVEGTFTSRRAPDGPVLLSGRWMAERH
ncbi:MAG TPA: hypothetical protein VM365_08935 [Gemmatimonadales bacterium]|nr:hypothetical protein [Gemmatimonadales bacterium]